MRHVRPAVYALALVPVLFWGASFPAMKVALRSFSPLGLACARAWIGLGTLGVLLAWRGAGGDVPRPGDAGRIAAMALMGLVAQSLLQAFALTMTSAVHSGWLITMIPLFTAVLSAAFLRERFPPLKVVGTLLGFTGAAAVMTGGGGLSVPSARGDLLILSSAFNWSLYTLVAHTVLRRRAALPLTVRTLATGALMITAIYALRESPAEFARASAESWGAVAFLGVGCTGIAWWCWSAALERLEPGTLTSFQYLQPLVTSVASTFWIGEPVTTRVAVGGALALSGVFLVQRGAAVVARLSR